MIDIGSFRAWGDFGVTRRAFVRAAFAVPFAAKLGAQQALAETEASRGPAKSVIFL